MTGKNTLLWAAIAPIAFLLITVGAVLVFGGSDMVATYSWAILLLASLVGLAIGFFITRASDRHLRRGLLRSMRQTLPAVPMLFLIGSVSATWMLSGVVPLLIDQGLHLIDPKMFLIITCVVCAIISVLTGSSWTTIATIGVAFMGIGGMLGYSPGWIAGAIISGAYFGDKVSPLSDTTVLASSSCGVDLFSHIRYMLLTTIPSILIALAVFGTVGFSIDITSAAAESKMTEALRHTFNLNPWIYVIPLLTLILIALRINTLITLAVSSLLGLAGVFIFQPQILGQIHPGAGDHLWPSIIAGFKMIGTSTHLATGNPALDDLVETGGMAGMSPTVGLVLSAMLFGGVMMGTSVLNIITSRFTSLLRNRISTVGATVTSGLFLNAATADQYLSLIIGGNIYKTLYRQQGLEGRLLSRTLEDSVSVTSVLIPWNSCGVTQSSVLGVATIAYLPCCVFNYVSPLMSLLMAVLAQRGAKILALRPINS
ncbi:MAG: sodium:proton antiporter [Muribaculaceae bacterium]|nr:sodium:proton antiporter [Muribaculaceae bacterium]